MNRRHLLAGLAACLALAGCHHANPSTGNDTEAALDPPMSAAPHRSAAEALAGVAREDVQPQTMSQADLDSLGGMRNGCVFRLTADAWPSFVYGGPQAGGVLKLNETLVTLPRASGNTFADGGLQVSLRPLGKSHANGTPQDADLIIRLAGVPQELGFKGYTDCRAAAALALGNKRP